MNFSRSVFFPNGTDGVDPFPVTSQILTRDRDDDALDVACKDHRQQVNLPKLWKTGWWREHAPPPTEEIQRQINERLSQTEPVQPVGIGYCENVLWDPTYIGYQPDFLGGVIQGDCAQHASVIIGRRRDPKTTRCEYLVQNSMGTDCKIPSEMPDGSIRRISFSSRWTCDHGRIWVDAEALGSSIGSIDYFE
jgi:hypothetical protein